jgi:small-conductance mechanosensitive channel
MKKIAKIGLVIVFAIACIFEPSTLQVIDGDSKQLSAIARRFFIMIGLVLIIALLAWYLGAGTKK